MLILGFGEDAAPRALAAALKVPAKSIQVHHFPDGESSVRVPTGLPATVIFYLSLHHPNAKLVELLLARAAAVAHGCERAILVAPYLCYMRQDKEFEPGQAVSQRIIGELLSRHFSAVITVDPHLHRIQHLGQALPHCQARSLSAAPLLGQRLAQWYPNALLVGPDAESEQWVSAAAGSSGLGYTVAEKVRHGDRNVAVSLPAGNYRDRHAILLDDVISSGHTMKQAAMALRQAGCQRVDAACTHALFAPGAEAALTDAGITEIISCNSIPHPSNRIDLSPLLAAAVAELDQSQSQAE
ncbi:MAG: phosphoribosylpyrophosphate synthetase [Pseudomonadales bacterium]|nr:phosphoribosylpyrophosphate synthetase [Pseudomonadales bacterium]